MIINEKIKSDEHNDEILINKFRFVIAFLYALTVALFAIFRKIEGLQPFPAYGFIPNNLFLLFSVFLYFYLRKVKTLHRLFKYICVTVDMTIISASIWVGCSYPHLDPPIAYLSIWALFYSVLILLGAFRYSVKCAYFSGIYAGLLYFLVVLLRKDTLDLPYYFVLNNETLNLNFPVYNESLRVIAMMVTGWVTGMACKRRIALFNTMIESETAAAQAASKTVKQTRSMAKIIQKSTDEIFQSSKNIFSTANNQAASVQEIESTINENTQIAGDIAEKTGSVADIASRMEDDVLSGFSVLGQNVKKMEDIKNKNDDVIAGIIQLGKEINKIREIIISINDITDQTKVIAFNAALEAASAGDRGKRFSVVASEVNRLADDIAALTKQIRNQIDGIKKTSSLLIVSSEESANKIREGNSLIKKLEDIFYEIRTGAEETASQVQIITVSTKKQQKSIGQINTAIADIAEGLSNFLQSTEIATASAEGLTRMTEELGNLLNVKEEGV